MNSGRGGGGGGGTERSEWRQAFLYTRCVCFGCTGKDQQMTGFAGEDNGSTSSSMVDTNSVHRRKEKTTTLTMRLPAETSQAPTQSRGLDESLCAIHAKKDVALNDDEQILSSTLDDATIGRRLRWRLRRRRRRRHRSRHSPPGLLMLLPSDDDEQEEEERSLSSSSSSSSSCSSLWGVAGGAGGGGGGARQPSCSHQTTTNHLSLLSASRHLRVLLDLQYLTEAFRVLNSANQWSFNVFTLNKLTNGRSLYYMTLHLFNQYDFLRAFCLDVTRLMRCITLIESSYYFSNPYHNSVHAADVVQAMFCHLNEPKMAHGLKPLEKMAAILSAACHDVDHPGTNQGFLIATANPLCSLYNNISILENHHWRATIGILHESKLFEHLDRDTWMTMKHLIQKMILATDITRQTEILSVFREHLANSSLNLSSSEQHRSFILQITLKCADISNPCRPWHLSKCWSELICEEFFKQGDHEERLGLPVTPICDRSQSTIATIQTGFMTHVAEPLFIEWDRFSATSNSRKLLDNLQHNRGQWESITLQEKSSHTAVMTAVQAVAEINSETLEPADQVKIENLDGQRNADASVADADLVSSESRRSFQRRHSLPVATSIRTSTDRRLSLPSGYPSAASVISRLTCLSEVSHPCEDAFSSVRKSKMRRCSFEDCKPDQLMSSCNKQHIPNQQRDPRSSETKKDSQRLCVKLENNHSQHQKEIDFCTNVGRANGSRVEDRALPCYTTNVCQPESERGGNRWQVARKMSLVAPRDQQMMTVIVGRKRSRSLVTSTLVCAFEENKNTAAALQSLEANLLNGFVQAKQEIDSSSWGRWLAWWHKRTKNHLCTNKVPPGTLNADAYHCHLPGEGDNVENAPPPVAAAPSSVGVGRAMPSVQLLSCECPVLVTRLVDSHCRLAKSSIISRKPTSVFASSPARDDAEAMPLLAANSTCIWNNEM